MTKRTKKKRQASHEIFFNPQNSYAESIVYFKINAPFSAAPSFLFFLTLIWVEEVILPSSPLLM